MSGWGPRWSKLPEGKPSKSIPAAQIGPPAHAKSEPDPTQPESDPGLFPAVCCGFGLQKPCSEFSFHPTRNWRFDWAWPEHRIAVEIEGGIWRPDRGAHGRPASILRDMEKYNAATMLGWRILRYTPDQLYQAPGDVVQLLGARDDASGH